MLIEEKRRINQAEDGSKQGRIEQAAALGGITIAHCRGYREATWFPVTCTDIWFT